MADALRFLIIDGYDKAGRQELQAGGASVAGELYRKMLGSLSPGCQADIVYPADPDGALPPGAGIDQYDGVAWTGSSLTVYHDDPRVDRQIGVARAAMAHGVPSFGSCWAAQIAAVLAGGVVAANPRGREMGLARKIALTPAGRGHPLYVDKPSVFDAFISHVDEIIKVPAGAVVLAGNDFTSVQALAVTYEGGSFWSVQYHPEYDLHEIARLTYVRRQKLVELGFFAGEAAALDYVGKLEALHQDPGRKDLAWLLGIDADVMNADVRRTEVRNWIAWQVLPNLRR